MAHGVYIYWKSIAEFARRRIIQLAKLQAGSAYSQLLCEFLSSRQRII